MMKSLIGITLASLLLVADVASAEVLTHAGAKVQINVPKGWHQKQDGDVLHISAPSNELQIVFIVLSQSEAKQAFKEMDKAVEDAVGEVEWERDGKAAEEEINGMPAWEWNGSAKNETIYVDVLSIDTPSNKNLGVYYFSSGDAEKKYKADIEAIVKGLKPMK
jgi:hypothetical protein